MPKTPKKTQGKKTAVSKKTPPKKKKPETATASQKAITDFNERVLTLVDTEPDFQKLAPEQLAFAVWYSMPKSERGDLKAFAASIGTSRQNCYNWMNNDVVMRLRTKLMGFLIRKHTPDVLHNLATRASFTDTDYKATPDIKLFLQYAEQWAERTEIDPVAPMIVFGAAFPQGSQFIKPQGDDPVAGKQNLAQIHGKQTGEMLGKKAHKEGKRLPPKRKK